MSSGAQSGAGFFGDDLSETRMATVLSQSHSKLLHTITTRRGKTHLVSLQASASFAARPPALEAKMSMAVQSRSCGGSTPEDSTVKMKWSLIFRS